jgi:hypothetical protein
MNGRTARSVAAAAALLWAGAALAEGEFAAGSEAQSWGLFGEKKGRFEGRVVDALCTIGEDCPADCGAGQRQMGIVRSADDVFVLAMKNMQPLFNGAAVDLAPYCGQTVEVDGLFVGDPSFTPGLRAKLYQVQTVRVVGAESAAKTDRWTVEWEARHPEAAGKGPWFQRDPNIRAQIEANGHLGLGAEADEAFREENF